MLKTIQYIWQSQPLNCFKIQILSLKIIETSFEKHFARNYQKHTGRNPGFDRVLIEDLLLEDVVLEDVMLEDVVLEDVVLEDVLLEDVF